MPPEKPIVERTAALHAWYQANVLPQRLTPEVERLWFGFFKQGYNGQQLARVIRYLRRQISLGNRKEGALLLRNLLGPDESGSLTAFDEALALATSRKNLNVDRRLAELPEGEAASDEIAKDEVRVTNAASRDPKPQSPDPLLSPEAQLAEWKKLKESLQ